MSPVPNRDSFKAFLRDFREFAFAGNLIDLTVGLVIGTAFKQLTTSLVEDIIMPPIGLLIGNADFSQLYISLNGLSYPSLAIAESSGAPVLRYGAFITQAIDFTIVAFTLYLVLRYLLRHQPKK